MRSSGWLTGPSRLTNTCKLAGFWLSVRSLTRERRALGWVG
jgi:hypothetical protein